MTRYVVHKLLHTLLVAFGVLTLAFLALRASGDPLVMLLPAEATRQEVEKVRADLGLDQPLSIQYLHFLGSTVRGDFGKSIRHNQAALGLVLERMQATAQLTGAALTLAIVTALPLGVLASVRRGTRWDHAAMAFAVLGQAIPYFWLGLMLMLLFAVTLEWLPTGGSDGPQFLILPAVTLGWYSAASIARMVRTSMLEVLGRDYLTAARARGLGEWAVVTRHAFKNAAIPVVTLIGLQLGAMLGGAVVIETIFAWPGVGRLLIQAILGRDYPVVQAAVFTLAMSFVVLNLLVDLLYGYLDPRVRVGAG